VWATIEVRGGEKTRMLFDAEPHPKGKWELIDTPDGKIGRYMKGRQLGLFPGDRHRPHWASCPDADRWRKKR
jgi:hypothetical protein